MIFTEKIINIFYNSATGGKLKRIVLTPVFGIIFVFITSLFVIAPLYIDSLLNIPRIKIYPVNLIITLCLFIPGIWLVIWSNLYVFRVKGTPVPANPPPVLITGGPFRFSRNPMTAGYFLIMFSIGIYFGSVLSIFIFTPAFIILHTNELKTVEEPELIKRLGQEYLEYMSSVPMFIPRLKKQK
jgi:protein-S-isoprenylcysteine O-methyltransferase Ste14